MSAIPIGIPVPVDRAATLAAGGAAATAPRVVVGARPHDGLAALGVQPRRDEALRDRLEVDAQV